MAKYSFPAKVAFKHSYSIETPYCWHGLFLQNIYNKILNLQNTKYKIQNTNFILNEILELVL